MATNDRVGQCVVCDATTVRLWRHRGAVRDDLGATVAVGHRLMLCDPSDVYRCATCGSLFRDPADVPDDLVDRYRRDPYDDAELLRLHRLGRRRHARDRRWLHDQGMRPGHRILEVGSYAGALLASARAVGCDAIGIDVGRDTSSFARAMGFEVITGALEQGQFRASSFDAVFVHNCFEQLPDPYGLLATVRRLLPTGGSLVIRTPDACFASRAHEPDHRRRAEAEGILGVPFVRCFTAEALAARLRAAGFAPGIVRREGSPWMEVAALAA